MDSLPSGPHPGNTPVAINTGGQTSLRPLRALTRFVTGRLRRIQAFVAGFMIGMSVWTPFFVATAAEETR